MDDQAATNQQHLEQNNNVVSQNDGAVGGGLEPLPGDENFSPLSESDICNYWSEEEFDRDPHRALFYDAYRSTTASPDLDDDEVEAERPGEKKPLSLMDDYELWDYMDEETLKKRLKNHPELLEQITRKRKRMAELEENDGDDDDLCAVMQRSAKVSKYSEHTTVC
ncbi:uncharacterized protein LOC128743641 [Sabethes cyaneus]|uniref:uncharacterized protein LOC128743641 n=1 Tax=Sabethes cyaneus TaxID=53552 RepID=UPI00237DB19B|nr:uncharacterized protein LOC128743641 [Sabethes cyaneus]